MTQSAADTFPQRHAAPGAALAWLGHPSTLGALALLVVNDHLLKAAFPGPVTGKVSDFAGLVVAPPLLAVLAALVAPRVPADRIAVAAVGACGAAFTVMKTSGYGAAAASTAWSVLSGPSIVVADVTDLVALPALGLSLLLWRRVRRRAVADRLVRLVRGLVLLPAALLAVAATSYPQMPEAKRVAVWDDRIVRVDSDLPVWLVSKDGRAWQALDPEAMRAAAAAVPAALQVSACVPDDPGRCYRIRRGELGVDESHDGGRTWSASWTVSRVQRVHLERRYVLASPADVTSHELAVARTATGHVVVVANGRDGYAVRTEDGTWQRIGFRGATEAAGESSALRRNEPPPLVEENVATTLTAARAYEFGMAVSAVLLVLLLGGAAATRTVRHWVLSAAALTVWALGSYLVFFGLETGDMMQVVAVLGAGVALPAALVPLITTLARGLLSAARAGLLAGTALLTGIAVAAPFIGWPLGVPYSYRSAVTLAATAAAIGASAGLRIGWPGRPAADHLVPGHGQL